MRSWIQVGLLCALALAGAGCFETKQVITLNPDGSGKLVIDSFVSTEMISMAAGMGGGKAPPDANTLPKKAAADMVAKSKGVDAWSDVTYELAKDGRIHVAGTAFFPDYTKLKLEGPGGAEFKWTKDGKDMVLEVENKGMSPDGGAAGDANAAPPPALSDKEVEDALTKKRQEWQMSKAMMGQLLGSLKLETAFVLPGKVAEVSVLEKTDQGVRMVMDGKKMLEAIDKVMADDKIMKEAIKAGKDPTKSDAAVQAMQETMFGKKGPMRAKVSGDLKPLFDYKAEMGKAKAAQPAMMKTLGIEAPAEK